ncbi:hypothetical protein tb265_28170 [Gemmatimonadetes bacterium T265]|nr:hypothetical protein tb265_28170 [Gemmatimonadetes bacterium T265]
MSSPETPNAVLPAGAAGIAAPRRPVALVAAHGDLAAGLRSAVHQITGHGALLDVLSNRDMGGAEIERAMREKLAAADAFVVFTDLPAGSCALAARRVQRDRPDLTVVTGTNLGTLLDFVCAAEGACDGDVLTPEGARAAAARAVQRGQVALTQVPGAPRAG